MMRRVPARTVGGHRWCAVFFLFLLTALVFSGAAAVAEERPPGHSPVLWDLFDEEWEHRLNTQPLFATGVGDHRLDDQLPTVTPAFRATDMRYYRDLQTRLAKIDRKTLSEDDVINLEMFERGIKNRVRSDELGDWQLPWNADSGFHSGFARLSKRMTFKTTADYENYLTRLEQTPRYFGEQIDNLRAGLASGMTLPRVTIEGYEAGIEAHVVADPTESDFWEPFEKFPVAVPESDHERLRAAGRKAIMEGPVAAYKTLLRFFLDEYQPGARETLGAYDLPNGRDYYAHQIWQYTTLDMTPQEIHDIGRREVARIRSEMEAIVEEVGFEGTFDEFLTFLRTDERFYPKTAEDLLERAAWISKKMDGKLPSLFGKLPRLPYTVEPVPDSIAPKYTAGRYVGPAEGSGRPGIYWVNVYNLPSRPFYALEALSLHEAVPGHHLQGALARELEGVPTFRRHTYLSAFGEGWGLYSEYLGLEAGFYEDPYSNFGRLTYEMWRACRLVVDTGVHAMGWTRDQMLDYLRSNTALSLHETSTETDRYISWPGQALAYKMGEIEIRRLRRLAEDELGAAFDVRSFHDAVLAKGSVPLPVLAQQIERWIAEQKARPSASAAGG